MIVVVRECYCCCLMLLFCVLSHVVVCCCLTLLFAVASRCCCLTLLLSYVVPHVFVHVYVGLPADECRLLCESCVDFRVSLSSLDHLCTCVRMDDTLLFLNHPIPHLCSQWVRKLCEPQKLPHWKRNRNNYVTLLLSQVALQRWVHT